MRSPTGEQFHLSGAWGDHRTEAIVTELAAGIRTVTIDGMQVTEPFADSERPSFGNGIVLVPWPNRVKDGRWTLHGNPQQLDITEPKQGNAIHGLLRNTGYRCIERTHAAIALAATVFPQHGYPFLLDTAVRYEVRSGEFGVTHSIRNQSDAPAPVAVGAHPFLRVGDAAIEDLVVEVPAGTWFETDGRQIPVAEHPVDGTGYDLRAGRRVGDLMLDTAFGAVQTDAGIARHRLTAPGGRWVELWQDADFAYVQVFVTEKFVRSGRPGRAVAIEPMTAPPNALNTGQGLRWLAPGETWSPSWGISAGHPDD